MTDYIEVVCSDCGETEIVPVDMVEGFAIDSIGWTCIDGYENYITVDGIPLALMD